MANDRKQVELERELRKFGYAYLRKRQAKMEARRFIGQTGTGRIVFSKEIEYTDFPLDEITLWFANNTIYLPNEH